MSEEAGPSAGASAPARSSGRNKVKSQRAMESEDTAKMFAAAKAKQKADAEAIARGEDVKPASASATDTVTKKPRTSRGTTATAKAKGKGKAKAKKEELYCVCKKPSDDDEGPMIECAECNDWFHFSCIELTEDAAERIHNYVCPDCTEATGDKTTMMYDISTFKSPSPPQGSIPTSAKRKAAKSTTATKSQATSTAGDSDDEVDNPPETSDSDSDSGSDATAPQPRQVKRPRSSKEPSQKPASDVKPTIPRPRPPPPANRTNTALLPKARLFVIDKLTELVKAIFVDKLDEEGVHRYAKNLEASLFEGFKDGQGAKAVAGGRYKTQFTLLDRSLPKARPELLADITSFQLPAAKVAHLTSADLASAERLEELEKAKKAALEQTVKQREYSGAIRMGRDGFEKVEDSREREMANLALQEQAARKEAQRRESMGGAADGETPLEGDMSPAHHRKESASASATPQIERKASSSLPQSPVVRHRESASASVDVPKSPVKTNFGLKSAWTSGPEDATTENQGLSLDDQTVLDLSDIVAVDEPEDVQMDLDDEVGDAGVEGKPLKETIEAKPVVWSGNITNPSVEGFKAVPISARLVVRPTFEPQWNTLLPHETIAISGRVPVPASLKFLSEIRMMPAKDSMTVVFTPSESANAEDKAGWQSLIDFHMQKGRHAIYHPYGTHLNVPHHGARELYLIPMLPGEAAPEFTDLLNDFSLPTDRDGPILLGVFVGEKKQLHLPAPSPTPVVVPIASPSTSSGTSGPALPNAKLQELMASLNPAALQALTGAKSPSAAGQPRQQQQQPAYPRYQQAYQHQAYDAYAPPQGGHSPYPPPGQGYNEQPHPYGNNNNYGGFTPDHGQVHGHSHQHQGTRGGHLPGWGGGGGQQYDRNQNQNRDDRWGQRGGGGGRRY